MNLDVNLLQFFILLLPGYITRVIAHNCSSITIDEEKNSDIRELLNIVLVSVIDILFTDLLIVGINRAFNKNLYSVYSDFCISSVIDLPVLTLLLFVSAIIGFLIAKVVDANVIYRILNAFNLTKNKSNETAWQYFNKNNKDEWIIVIDYDTKMKYVGYFENYEIDGEDKYVILGNVTVTNLDNATVKYERDNVLLKCNKESIVLEVKK